MQTRRTACKLQQAAGPRAAVRRVAASCKRQASMEHSYVRMRSAMKQLAHICHPSHHACPWMHWLHLAPPRRAVNCQCRATRPGWRPRRGLWMHMAFMAAPLGLG